MIDKLSTNQKIAAIGPLSNAASYQSIPLLIDPVTNEFSNNKNLGLIILKNVFLYLHY